MASSGISAAPGSLVKQFSWEVEGKPLSEDKNRNDVELQSALIEETRRRQDETEEQIRRLNEYYASTRWAKQFRAKQAFKQPNDEEVCRMMQSKLIDAMENFQTLNPNCGKLSTMPTSWKDVEMAISDILAKWERNNTSRTGGVKNFLRKVCTSLHNHSTVLKMLPSDSEYVSLIAGSINMIIKASANYERIVLSFTEGIIDINDAVKMTQNETALYQTPAVQQLTMRLYTHIFSYLTKFMTWFTDRSRKRFLHSFNENLSQIFEQDLANVRKLSSLISRQIDIQVAVDVKAARFYSEAAYENTKFLLELREAEVKNTRVRDVTNANLFQHVIRDGFMKSDQEVAICMQEIMEGYFDKARRVVAGEALFDLLEQQATIRQQPFPNEATSVFERGSPNLTAAASQVDEGKLKVHRNDDIKLWSSRFEEYFDREHILPLVQPQNPLLADAAFVSRLRVFTLEKKSQILYAHAEYQDENSDRLHQSSAQYVALCRSSKIPVVSHFCRLSHEDPPSYRTRETVELTALMYSMIRQIIEIMPPDLQNTTSTFNEDRFNILDGTLRTWEEALDLFSDLVRHVNLPVLVFVIDRINVLELGSDQNIDQKLRALINRLQLLQEPVTGHGQTYKMLLTTAGLSPSLCKMLETQEMVNIASTPSRRTNRPRRTLPPFTWE